MNTLTLYATWIPIAVLILGASATAEPPPQIPEYLPFFVSYAAHAETIWHEAGDGGYWGDGRSGGNGGIRGTSNLTLAFAMLVHAYDEGWLTGSQRKQLSKAGLKQQACLDRVRKSWSYLAQSHVTGEGHAADNKKWGRSWQSSLWVGASGLAALLVWDHLDDDVRSLVERVVVDEANRKIGVKPRNAKPGNTAAEENGWDTQAPAIAVALFPKHANTAKWLRAAEVLAANTYSVRADLSSEAQLGDERVRDVVRTANLFDDFTLDNHGFFHPSYLKVSGQEIGEAWAMLALGDLRHGTSFARQFRPYALHHVGDTWQVMRRLLLPEGEYAYPSGSDWAIHLCSSQSYFAFIATALGDPLAALAERRGFTSARWRMRASSRGRFLGATNFEWWWEPIALKRFATAMLHFVLNPEAAPEPAAAESLWDFTETFLFPDVKVFGHRTPRYFASVSMRRRPMGITIPLGVRHLDHPYVTTPRIGSILPPGSVEEYKRYDHARGTALVMRYADGSGAAMVALRDVVLWISSGALSPMGIQNDNVVSPKGRMIRCAAGSQRVPALAAMKPFSVRGAWLNIDDQLGLITEAGFSYAPAGKYTRRSAAEDLVSPQRGRGGTCMLVAPRYSAAQTKRLAKTFSVRRTGRRHEARFCDGAYGPMVHATIELGWGSRPVPPTSISLTGEVSPRFPIRNMIDGDPASYTVLRNKKGKGPLPQSPVVLEFSMPKRVDKLRALRIVPRPRYGPREVTLEVQRARAWQIVTTVQMGHVFKDIDLPAVQGVKRFRLTISMGWDRGRKPTSQPRNTQIAELSFLLAGDAQALNTKPTPPFELHVIEPGKENQ